MKILQIVPRLRPAICGVGDYACALAEEWQKHGVETCFLGGDPKAFAGAHGFPAESVDARNGPLLHAQLGRLHARTGFDVIVLQCSGYGFAARGAPVWLARGLERWLAANQQVPLLTMFHELFANGSVTSSAFWWSPLQKWVCAKLARNSKMIRTNRGASASWLESVAPVHKEKAGVLPVFSNMGEQLDAPRATHRPRTLVMFGYQAEGSPDYWRELSRVACLLGIEKVVDLGRSAALPAEVRHLRIEQRGVLTKEEMSEVLRQASFGYLRYNPEFLGKSGILAAYAAHGVVPVLAPWAGSLSEGLQDRMQVLRVETITGSVDGRVLDDISSSLRQWYAPHAIKDTAADYLKQAQHWK